jgi:hypothetical protein
MLAEVIPTAIPLHDRHGAVKAWALVDSHDWERVKGFRWYQAAIGYVVSAARSGRRAPKQYLHRFLLGLKPGDGREADHINRDRLDNRRANLRITTRGQNAQNVPGYNNGAARHSRHRGVAWHKGMNQWEAYATLSRRKHRLGFFDNEDEAAKVAREFRVAHMTHAID